MIDFFRNSGYKLQCLIIGYLELSTTAIMENFDLTTKKGGEIQVLSVLTKPFTSLIIQVFIKDVKN